MVLGIWLIYCQRLSRPAKSGTLQAILRLAAGSDN